MEVIRQEDDGDHVERLFGLYGVHGSSQVGASYVICEQRTTFCSDDSEEERASWLEVSQVIGHSILSIA